MPGITGGFEGVMERYVSTIAALIAALWDALPEPAKALVFGTVIAWVRVLYDDKEPRHMRRFLEGLLCGLIALAVSSGAEVLGAPAGVGTVVGGMVGLFGADKVREWALSVAQRRADKL